MSNLLRVVLTYKNPSKYEMVQLTNLLYTGTSLSDQQIYVAAPETNILHFSYKRLDNIKLSHALSLNDITPEFLEKFKEKLK